MSDSDLLPFRVRLLDYMSKVDEASPLQAMDDLRGEYGHKKYFTKEKVIEDFLSMQANEQVVQTRARFDDSGDVEVFYRITDIGRELVDKYLPSWYKG